MELEIKPADLAAGRARIEHMVRSMDPSLLQKALRHPRAKLASEQPWLLAGISDGMGLHTAVAAIESGVCRHGLGIYWEPPHFLERREDGTPVSGVHWARVQNAAALQEWAREKGADFHVLAANVIMAPDRDLKGNAKGEPSSFSAQIREAFEPVRKAAPNEDAIFVNSVAFGKWISPREGEDPISVPTVDFEGRIIEMRTKAYHARGYQETLDTMGRNHGLLLESIRQFGWLGPDALTVFFTWAGGSQNVDVLEGIYGKGALGDAKVIAESDVARFRLEHGMELGSHAIVRLPAFLSAALMGIPGGGLFGLISRGFLEDRDLFEGMPSLAERMIDRLFGPGWVRENPISQIELDTAETLHIEEISARVDEAHQRIAKYRAEHPDEADGPIELEQSKRLLAGLVPRDHERFLRRFDPDAAMDDDIVESAGVEIENGSVFDVTRDELGGDEFRPDLMLVQALRPLAKLLREKGADQFAVHSETLRLNPDALKDAGSLRCRISWTNGKDQILVNRTIENGAGEELLRGETTIGPRHEHPTATADPHLLGEAVGPRMPVRVSLHTTYEASEDLRAVLQAPALIGFARENLKAAGVFEEETPKTWDIRIDGTVDVGDHLLTYARRESDGWVVTVVDDASRPLLQMTLR